MLHLHRSNQVEMLAEKLAFVLGEHPQRDPMCSEVIAVHHESMGQWLSHRLCQRLGENGARGISANFSYTSPGGLIHELIGATLGEPQDQHQNRWDPNSLRFSVLQMLPKFLKEDEFYPIANYLEKSTEGTIERRELQLATKIAKMFDRYAVYRPEMIKGWLDPHDQSETLEPQMRWQPILWRALRSELHEPSLAERLFDAMKLLKESSSLPEQQDFPKRMSFFGLSALPPGFLGFVRQIAHHLDIHLYLLCPSQAYWADIRQRREQLHDVFKHPGSFEYEEYEEKLQLEIGNPLLSSFGRMGRDFQWLLESNDGIDSLQSDSDIFVDPLLTSTKKRPSVLTRLQHDVLHLVNRSQGSENEVDPGGIDSICEEEDESISFLACHGPMRQVEVLHQKILSALNNDESLQPREIIVMVVDLEKFAPLISAVFSQGEYWRGSEGWGALGTPRIPFQILDQSIKRSHPIAELIADFVNLAGSRVGASTVLQLLSHPCVAKQFSLNEEEVQDIRSWIIQSGIRWGIDAEERELHHQPREYPHTWKFGLDRLLLGVCMADEEEKLFMGVSPFDDMEGSSVDVVGKFADFCHRLFKEIRNFKKPRSLTCWYQDLEHMLSQLCELTGQEEAQLQRIRECAKKSSPLLWKPEKDEIQRPMSLEAFVEWISELFETVEQGSKASNLSALTFCSFTPMRMIPHRIVCWLGMDDGCFPRSEKSENFDLMQNQRRVGDRNARDEDCYLMLESVLAARERLIVSYCGRDPKSNQSQAPAVPVAELMDTIDTSFKRVKDPAGSVLAQMIQEYPLQAFSPNNFIRDGVGTALSYDRVMLAGASHILARAPEQRQFMRSSLPWSQEEIETKASTVILLEDVIRFFENPAKFLLKTRLGISLQESFSEVEDREPIELDPLDQWKVGDRTLQALRDKASRESIQESLLAKGILPTGTPGLCEFSGQLEAVESLLEKRSHWTATTSTNLAIVLQLHGIELRGNVSNIWEPDSLKDAYSLVTLSYGSIKDKHLLREWIKLLAISLMKPMTVFNVKMDSVHVKKKDTKKRKTSFVELPADPKERAEFCMARLGELLAIFQEGQTRMIPYFPNSTPVYAREYVKIIRKKSVSLACAAGLKQAKAAWKSGRDLKTGDGEDPSVRQILGEKIDLGFLENNDEFATIALQVWKELLEAEVDEHAEQ